MPAILFDPDGSAVFGAENLRVSFTKNIARATRA
jgi:hypothetical protein